MKENDITQLAILVVSCDKYSDLWDDFFNLKERFWPDCPYPCYLSTDTVDYQRAGVNLIHFGNIRLWSECVREALKQIKEPYVALFLEDAFIYKKIDSKIIAEDLKFVIDYKADFLTLERNRMEKVLTVKDNLAPHIWRIDRHKKYGIDTSAAIWDKSFLMKALEKKNCNAWQFEVNFCREAESENGLQGNIFFDERQPLNISPVEVVQLGELSRDAIKFFHVAGYEVKSSRKVMSWWRMMYFRARLHLDKLYIREFLKSLFKFLGVKFFS